MRELKPQEQLAVDLKSQKTKKENEADKKHSRSSSKDSAKKSDKDKKEKDKDSDSEHNQSLKSIVIQTTEQVVTDIPVIETEEPVKVIMQEPEKVDEDEAST